MQESLADFVIDLNRTAEGLSISSFIKLYDYIEQVGLQYRDGQNERIQAKINPFVKTINLAQVKLLIKVANHFRLEEAEGKINQQGAGFNTQSDKYDPGYYVQDLKYEFVTFRHN